MLCGNIRLFCGNIRLFCVEALKLVLISGVMAHSLGCMVWGSVYTLPETEAGFDFKFEGLRCRVFMVRI